MATFNIKPTSEVELPKDCFIAVRVGNSQKLSRFQGTRKYAFSKEELPPSQAGAFGKVEIFRRLGACSFDLSSLSRGKREVEVGCNDDQHSTLSLQVELGDPSNLPEKQPQKKQRNDDEADPGRESMVRHYLDRHNLDVRLSEAMLAVLADQPDDPFSYLASCLANWGSKNKASAVTTDSQASPERDTSSPDRPEGISCDWRIGNLRASSCTSPESEAKEVERLFAKAVFRVNESRPEFAGRYLSLRGSNTYIPRPGGMTLQEAEELEGAGLLFKLESSDSVCGRGVFTSTCGAYAAWVNESAHVKFIVKEGSKTEGAEKLAAFADVFAQGMRQEGVTVSPVS